MPENNTVLIQALRDILDTGANKRVKRHARGLLLALLDV